MYCISLSSLHATLLPWLQSFRSHRCPCNKTIDVVFQCFTFLPFFEFLMFSNPFPVYRYPCKPGRQELMENEERYEQQPKSIRFPPSIWHGTLTFTCFLLFVSSLNILQVSWICRQSDIEHLFYIFHHLAKTIFHGMAGDSIGCA